MRGSLVVVLAVLSGIAQGADAPVGNEHAMSKGYVPPKDPAVQKKLEWWQDLKFGLMMHWGTYSQWGIVESWLKPYEQGDWVFTARRDGTVYAILLAKDDQATLPQQVAMPAEILTGRAKVQLLGFGVLKAGATEDAKTTFTIPDGAQGKLPANYAWVFKLEKNP